MKDKNRMYYPRFVRRIARGSQCSVAQSKDQFFCHYAKGRARHAQTNPIVVHACILIPKMICVCGGCDVRAYVRNTVTYTRVSRDRYSLFWMVPCARVHREQPKQRRQMPSSSIWKRGIYIIVGWGRRRLKFSSLIRIRYTSCNKGVVICIMYIYVWLEECPRSA